MARSKKRKSNDESFPERILVQLQKAAMDSEIPVIEAPDLESATNQVKSVPYPVFLFAWVKLNSKERAIVSYEASVPAFIEDKGILAGHRKYIHLVMAGREILKELAETMNADLGKGVQVFAPETHP